MKGSSSSRARRPRIEIRRTRAHPNHRNIFVSLPGMYLILTRDLKIGAASRIQVGIMSWLHPIALSSGLEHGEA